MRAAALLCAAAAARGEPCSSRTAVPFPMEPCAAPGAAGGAEWSGACGSVATSANWAQATCWSGGAAPGAGDTAVFPAAASPVTIDFTHGQADNLTATAAVVGGVRIDAGADVTMRSGALEVREAVVVAGTLTLDSGFDECSDGYYSGGAPPAVGIVNPAVFAGTAGDGVRGCADVPDGFTPKLCGAATAVVTSGGSLRVRKYYASAFVAIQVQAGGMYEVSHCGFSWGRVTSWGQVKVTDHAFWHGALYNQPGAAASFGTQYEHLPSPVHITPAPPTPAPPPIDCAAVQYGVPCPYSEPAGDEAACTALNCCWDASRTDYKCYHTFVPPNLPPAAGAYPGEGFGVYYDGWALETPGVPESKPLPSVTNAGKLTLTGVHVGTSWRYNENTSSQPNGDYYATFVNLAGGSVQHETPTTMGRLVNMTNYGTWVVAGGDQVRGGLLASFHSGTFANRGDVVVRRATAFFGDFAGDNGTVRTEQHGSAFYNDYAARAICGVFADDGTCFEWEGGANIGAAGYGGFTVPCCKHYANPCPADRPALVDNTCTAGVRLGSGTCGFSPGCPNSSTLETLRSPWTAGVDYAVGFRASRFDSDGTGQAVLASTVALDGAAAVVVGAGATVVSVVEGGAAAARAATAHGGEWVVERGGVLSLGIDAAVPPGVAVAVRRGGALRVDAHTAVAFRRNASLSVAAGGRVAGDGAVDLCGRRMGGAEVAPTATGLQLRCE